MDIQPSSSGRSALRAVGSRFVLALAAFLLGPYGAWVQTVDEAPSKPRADAVR